MYTLQYKYGACGTYKTQVIPETIWANGTISKPFRQYLPDILGKHNIKKLKKAAISGTAQIPQKVLMWKYKTYFTSKITLLVPQIVNTEQLQYYVTYKHSLFRVYNCKYPAKIWWWWWWWWW
jgi:hypothetical protein